MKETEAPSEVYVGTISSINGLDRKSFSMTLNDLAQAYPDALKIDGVYRSVNGDLPPDHLLVMWLEYLADSGLWSPWMVDATEVTHYTFVMGTCEM